MDAKPHLRRALALGVAAMVPIAATAACGRDVPDPAPKAEAAERLPPQTGTASFYSPEFAGRPTASGEPHDPRAMTAASRTLPLGAEAEVTNTETGRTVAVEVNDRGPYAKNRIIDVSPKAAERLGMKEDGVAKVTVRAIDSPDR